MGVFCGKLTKPCLHAKTFELVSQQSLASINNKNPNILTKRPPVATTVPSDTQLHHWGIGIWWILKFVGVFFCGKLTKLCPHAKTFQLVSQQSLASINNKNPNILTKRPPVATTATQTTSAIIGALVFDGFLNPCGCFLWKAYQTLSWCQNFPTGQPVNLGKY